MVEKLLYSTFRSTSWIIHSLINQGCTDPIEIPTTMIVFSQSHQCFREKKHLKNTHTLRSFESFVLTDSSLLIPQQFIYCPTCAQNLSTHLPGIQISHSRCLWTSIFDSLMDGLGQHISFSPGNQVPTCFVYINIWMYTLPETNIAHENPPFWRYLLETMGILMGYVSFMEGTMYTLLGTKMGSHLWKRNIIFKNWFKWRAMSVPKKGIFYIYICWTGMLFPLPLTLAPRMIAVLATHKLLVETECNFTFIWICLSSFWEHSSYQAAITGFPFSHLPKWYIHLRCIRTELLILCWSPSPGWWLITTRVSTFFVGNPDLNLHFPLLLGGGRPKIHYIPAVVGGFQCSNDAPNMRESPSCIYVLHHFHLRPTKYVNELMETTQLKIHTSPRNVGFRIIM